MFFFRTLILGLAIFMLGVPAQLQIRFAQASEFVEFMSAEFVIEPSPFKVRLAKKQGITLESKIVPSIPLQGSLYVPDGSGPFPAVILLHGCAGVEIWNTQWSERLVSWGYAVLNVDSFTPRGIKYICDGSDIGTASPRGRALDAFGARNYLTSLDSIDPNRIAVMGMSIGGTSVFKVIEEAASTGASTTPFPAAIALYPLCSPIRMPVTPILIMMGSKDQWMSSDSCTAYMDAQPTPNEISVVVFEGAHHLFDVEGIDVEEMGLKLRYDAEAANTANELIRSFLAKHLSTAQ